MRPRELRRLRRQAPALMNAVAHPLIEISGAPAALDLSALACWVPSPASVDQDGSVATPGQLEAAEKLREEHDLLHLGIPSDAKLWAAMWRARP